MSQKSFMGEVSKQCDRNQTKLFVEMDSWVDQIEQRIVF